MTATTAKTPSTCAHSRPLADCAKCTVLVEMTRGAPPALAVGAAFGAALGDLLGDGDGGAMILGGGLGMLFAAVLTARAREPVQPAPAKRGIRRRRKVRK